MRILITGAARGLGAALANHFSDAGHEVYAWDLRDPDMVDAPQGVIVSEVPVDEVDMCSEGEILAAWRQLDPKPDVLINNAGVNRLSWLTDVVSTEEWEAVTGPVRGAQQLTGLFASFWTRMFADDQVGIEPRARVLNVSSVSARVNMRATATYCAAKAGMERMTKVAARELAGYGISVTAVAPGRIADGTEMGIYLDTKLPGLRGLDPADMARYEMAAFPLGRRVDMREVVQAVDLVLQLPMACTGTVLEVAGAQAS